MSYKIVCDDVLAWAAGYEGEKFHAALLDPPYHLKGGFMSKDWDKDGPDAIAFQPDTWKVIAEHLYPGAFLMAFGGSRTHHRMAVAMEDAGLILHPTLVHLQAQGFPKASRIDTAIDKAAGAEREVVNGQYIAPDGKPRWGGRLDNSEYQSGDYGKYNGTQRTAPATPLAATWAGHRYGLQALKPCAEFILCAQKPYSGRPVESIVATGAGALWIDGARVGYASQSDIDQMRAKQNKSVETRKAKGKQTFYVNMEQYTHVQDFAANGGRWPPNVCLSHVSPHPCPACDGDGCPDCGGDGWLEGCRRVGVKRVRGGCRVTSIGQGREGNHTLGIYGAKESKVVTAYADPDGTEQVDDWQCVEGCPVRALGEMSGERPSRGEYTRSQEKQPVERSGMFGGGENNRRNDYANQTGTAARFYPQSDWRYEIEERLAGVTPFLYQAKAGRRERDSGLEHLRSQDKGSAEFTYARKQCSICGCTSTGGDHTGNEPGQMTCGHPMSAIVWVEYDRDSYHAKIGRRNPHPTVKPIALNVWLATLLLPPPEYAPRRLLVPFAGSGSEICGALLAGWDEVVGVEMEPEYVEICEARCRFWAGWSERGHDDPKEILKEAAKEKKQEPEPQMELL